MTPNVPETFREALRSIQDREYLATKRYREKQWGADRDGVDPQILLFERLLIRRMAKIGVPLYTTEGMRSAERQAMLKKAGRSQLLNGPHMVGMAVDIVHCTKLWDMHTKAWSLIGHVGEEIIAQEGLSIRWGGHWKKPYDPAHWERIDWRNVPSTAIPF